MIIIDARGAAISPLMLRQALKNNPIPVDAIARMHPAQQMMIENLGMVVLEMSQDLLSESEEMDKNFTLAGRRMLIDVSVDPSVILFENSEQAYLSFINLDYPKDMA